MPEYHPLRISPQSPLASTETLRESRIGTVFTSQEP